MASGTCLGVKSASEIPSPYQDLGIERTNMLAVGFHPKLLLVPSRTKRELACERVHGDTDSFSPAECRLPLQYLEIEVLILDSDPVMV